MMISWDAIPDLQLAKSVVKITEIFDSTENVKSATGFFFDYEDELFLVTNRHVVFDEDANSNPVALQLLLNTKDGLTENEDGTPNLDLTKHIDYKISLYEKDSPIWLEHPENLIFQSKWDKVDIAIIPLNKEHVLRNFLITRFNVKSFKPRNIPIVYGESLMVMGYPLGHFDELNNLPIVRNATLATAFSAYYKGRPKFLIDSRLHQGTSGSPVLINPSIPKFFNGAWSLPLPNTSEGQKIPMPFLLGIVSSCLTAIDPTTREYIGLSQVFPATLIPEIITHHKKSS